LGAAEIQLRFLNCFQSWLTKLILRRMIISPNKNWQRRFLTMKIRLLKLDPDRDIMHAMKWVNDPKVNFYFANMGKKSIEEERKFMREILLSQSDDVFSAYDDDEYVGQVSINRIDWLAETGRLFLVITPSQQGKGYAREIVNAILKVAFLGLVLNKVWLIVRQENQQRIEMWKACGFIQEGVLREEYKDSRGKRHDMARLAILKREWSG